MDFVSNILVSFLELDQFIGLDSNHWYIIRLLLSNTCKNKAVFGSSFVQNVMQKKIIGVINSHWIPSEDHCFSELILVVKL